jgi:beta-ureidopropionase / N-carbamoyl-L-amino-acid hydrolase
MALQVDPSRTIAELRELARLTSDEGGAQRLCWTPTWVAAREWFDRLLEGLPVDRETDAAGNRWFVLRGSSDEAVLLGSHIDSVPNGGWLDGALGLLGGLEVLRAVASHGTPPVTVKLVDWADEEGARFGYGMFGSSAASGSLDVAAVRELRDRDGKVLAEVVREHGVDVDRTAEARANLEGAFAYVELHIEQGPVLERLDLPLAAVLGTTGVERHVVRFSGQAAHAGSTPMEDRRDGLAAAARLLLSVREQAREAGATATVGRCVTRPGIATAVAGEAEITVDQRNMDGGTLAAMLERAKQTAARIAEQERVTCEWSRLWGIEPIAFDDGLIALVDDVVGEVAGERHRMPSGPLHDAAEVARAGVPTVMMFVQSLRGLSHTKEEDTRPEHLELAVRALAQVVERLLGRPAEGKGGEVGP